MPKTDTPKVDPEATVRRVVVFIVKGRLAGLPKIVGHMAVDPDVPFPIHIRKCDLGDHHGDVMLVKDHPKYVLYREVK